MKFCPDCGNKLVLKQAGDDGLIPYCNCCNKYYFDVFPICVIAMIVNEFDEAILLKQSYLSDKYMTFPAGYMTSGESAEQAITREVKEETGLSIFNIKYSASCWFNAKKILMLGFTAKCKKSDFTLSQEVDAATWVKLNDVPNFLFPEHPDNVARMIYCNYIEENKCYQAQCAK